MTLAAALVLSFFFALPAFLSVRAYGQVTLRACLFGGLGVGAVPALLGALGLFATDEAWDGGAPSVVDHVPTLHGLVSLATLAAMMTALGVASAFVFWLVLTACRALPAINRHTEVMPRALPTAAAVLLAFGLTGFVVSLPRITRDRSCHNIFRDDKTPPERLTLTLSIPRSDWPRLRALATDFAQRDGLSLRDDSADSRNPFDLNICGEGRATIMIEELSHEIGWIGASGPAPAPAPPARGEITGVVIDIYALSPDTAWQGSTRDLVATLDRTWPGRLSVMGDDGKHPARPKWLPPAP